MRDVERVEDLGLGDLVGARLDHQDGLFGAGDDEVEVGVLERVLLLRVDDEVAVDLADPHRRDGHRERDVGDHQRGGRAVHREDVERVDVIDAQRQRDELRLTAPALGEQRAQGAVDHARDERALLGAAALALEERAGDLARGVHALLDVHRQREEVDIAEVARGRCAQNHGVALTDDDGAGGLLGHLAGLEGDLGSCDLDGDTGLGSTHMKLSFCSGAPVCSVHLRLSRGFGIRTPVIVAQLRQPLAVGNPGKRAVADEQRRRRRRPGGQRGARVALHARGHQRVAAIGVEAREVEPQVARALPEMRVVEPALVGVQRVGEGPERALRGGGLGGAGDRHRALVLARSAMWRKTTRAPACVRRSWASAQRGHVKSA